MSWVVIAVAGALDAVAGALVVVVSRRMRRERRRRLAEPRLSRREQCAVCHRWLRPDEVRELRSVPDDDEQLGIAAFGGGSFMSETYCAKHYPG